MKPGSWVRDKTLPKDCNRGVVIDAPQGHLRVHIEGQVYTYHIRAATKFLQIYDPFGAFVRALSGKEAR